MNCGDGAVIMVVMVILRWPVIAVVPMQLYYENCCCCCCCCFGDDGANDNWYCSKWSIVTAVAVLDVCCCYRDYDYYD